MTSPPPLRLVAAALALGVTAALLTTVSGPASAATDPAGSSTARSQQKPHGHHKHKGKVRWDSTVVYVGTPIAAHGRTPKGRAKVKLQVKLPGGWHTIGKTRSSRKGKFSISGTLDWYGTHKVRVTTSGRRAFKRSAQAQVLINYLPRGNPADHAFTDADRGIRYSFDPCDTIRYAVNTDDVGPAGLAMVQVGMAQVSAATGIKVEYVGTSHQIPFQTEGTRLPAGQDLLIGWATEQELPAFPATPAIGFGGPIWVRKARDGSGHAVSKILESGVVLDTDAYFDTTTYSQSYWSTKPTWGEVILHELGHAFGLAHVQATDEIMYPAAGRGLYPDGTYRGLYDAGDLAGLATNGLGQGCFRLARHREAAERIAAPAPQP